MNIDFDKINTLIKLIRPKYYNILTRILVVAGLALFSKPIWVDILNIFFENFNFSLIGQYDWLVGLIVIFLALLYNVVQRYLELKFENNSSPAYKNVEFKKIESFANLCQEILPLLRDNEYIFKTTGPNSGLNEIGELRNDLTLWNKLKKESILPNNEAIKKIIIDNKSIIPAKYIEVFNFLTIHIDAFKEHINNPQYDYTNYQFPKELPTIVNEVCYDNAKLDKDLQKKIKWITSKMKTEKFKEWFIFGSAVLTPAKANDIDLAILINNKENEGDTILQKLNSIRADFKLKFKKDLHLSIFDVESLDEYNIFSERNQYKIGNNG